jgi:hypothetical protein
MQTKLGTPEAGYDFTNITTYIWCKACKKAHRLSEEYHIWDLEIIYKQGELLAAVTDLEKHNIPYTYFGEVVTNF